MQEWKINGGGKAVGGRNEIKRSKGKKKDAVNKRKKEGMHNQESNQTKQ